MAGIERLGCSNEKDMKSAAVPSPGADALDCFQDMDLSYHSQFVLVENLPPRFAEVHRNMCEYVSNMT